MSQIFNFKTIVLSVEKRVARIVLDRPKKRNAFNQEMISEIQSAFALCSDPSRKISVVILSGAGPTFCAGADLLWMKDMATFSFDENVSDARSLSDMFESIDNSVPAVICCVRGNALGGGVGLAAAADYCIATESSRFAFTEVSLGLRPSTISLYCVPKLGAARAKDLFCSGRQFSAHEAVTFGLIDEVVSEATFDERVDALLEIALHDGKEGLASASIHIAPSSAQVPIPDGPVEMLALVDRVDAGTSRRSDETRAELREFLIEDIAKARTSPEAQTKMREFLERLKSVKN